MCAILGNIYIRLVQNDLNGIKKLTFSKFSESCKFQKHELSVNLLKSLKLEYNDMRSIMLEKRGDIYNILMKINKNKKYYIKNVLLAEHSDYELKIKLINK